MLPSSTQHAGPPNTAHITRQEFRSSAKAIRSSFGFNSGAMDRRPPDARSMYANSRASQQESSAAERRCRECFPRRRQTTPTEWNLRRDEERSASGYRPFLPMICLCSCMPITAKKLRSTMPMKLPRPVCDEEPTVQTRRIDWRFQTCQQIPRVTYVLRLRPR